MKESNLKVAAHDYDTQFCIVAFKPTQVTNRSSKFRGLHNNYFYTLRLTANLLIFGRVDLMTLKHLN